VAKERKWSNLRGVLPEVEEELSDREQAIRKEVGERLAGVNEKGEPRAAKTMRELAQEYLGIKSESEFFEAEQRARDIKKEALERLVQDELKKVEEMSGQDTWRGEGILFSPKTSVIPVVKDRAALMKYLEDTKQTALLTLEYPRLKSLVVGKLEELVAMTPAERSEQTATLQNPIPGVEILLKRGVRPTET